MSELAAQLAPPWPDVPEDRQCDYLGCLSFRPHTMRAELLADGWRIVWRDARVNQAGARVPLVFCPIHFPNTFAR